MSDLRGRIAVALASEKWVNLPGNGYDMDDLRALADVVISELGLLREWRATGNSCAGAQETIEEALLYGDTTESRYVTDWKADV
jgi:hypothetical protein